MCGQARKLQGTPPCRSRFATSPWSRSLTLVLLYLHMTHMLLCLLQDLGGMLDQLTDALTARNNVARDETCGQTCDQTRDQPPRVVSWCDTLCRCRPRQAYNSPLASRFDVYLPS